MKILVIIPLLLSSLLFAQTKRQTFFFGNDSLKGIEKVVEVLAKDTSIFEGEYLHFFQNGAVRIKGKFENNKPVGLWDYNYESGKVKHRITYTSDSTSYWVYYFENGLKKKEGNVLNNKRDSLWTYYYEKGSVLKKGIYKQGLQDQQWNYYYEDGKTKAVALYKMGAGVYTEYYYDGGVKMTGSLSGNISNGLWSYYYDSGKVKARGYEKDGVKNGQWEYFYPNDSLASKGNYVNGAKKGEWQFYHENGQLSSEGMMSNGVRDGYWKLFNESGGFRADANLLNGTGTYKEYYDNNKLKVDGYLKNDKNHGHWEYFYDDGVLEGRADFIDGEGEYVGYYQSGELKMKGQIKDGKQIGTWELYDKEGQVIGYYKLVPNISKTDNDIFLPENEVSPPPVLSSDTIVSHKMPNFKIKRRKKFKPFQSRARESKGFIIAANPFAIVANQLPVSIEYFIQERLGHEVRYTLKRDPFFVPTYRVGDSLLFSNGFSIDFKQKFYSRFKKERGMLYFAHELRYTRDNYLAKNIDGFNEINDNIFEYAWTVGDRVLGSIKSGGVTFDIYAGLGLGFVNQTRNISQAAAPVFNRISTQKIQLKIRLGFALGYLF